MKIPKLTLLPMRTLLTSLILAVLMLLGGSHPASAVTKTLTVSWNNPNPSENGIARAAGDGDVWDFNVVLDGVVMVSGPTWGYPGKGAADPAWGLFAENGQSLSWSGATTGGTFAVSVKGRIRKIGGPGGGGGGEVEEKDFEASWSGEVKGKTWSPGPAIGVVMDPATLKQKVVNGVLLFDGRMTGPQNQTVSPATPAKVVVAPLKTLACAVEAASDFDEWTQDRNGDGHISTNPADNEKGYDTDVVTQTWSCSGGGFVLRDAQGHETLVGSVASTAENFGQWTGQWKAPATPDTYTISCTLNDQPTEVAAPDTGDRNDADNTVIRSAEVTVFSSSIRFLSDKVAAGAIPDSAHQARYEIKITDVDGNPLAGVPVVSPKVHPGGHGLFDIGEFGPNDDGVSASVQLDTNATDTQGTVQGIFTSGNRVGEPTKLMVPLNGDGSGPETGSIDQVWSELPVYREDNNDAWDYDDYFYFNQYSFITYRMAFTRNDTRVPITGHDIGFRTAGLAGDEWNWDLGYDWDGDGIVDGDYEHQVYSEDDDDTTGFYNWQGLIEWIDPIEDTPGSYTGWQKVNLNEDFIIDTLWFDATDYSASGSEGVR